MPTARLLPVSPSMHCSGWGVPVWGVNLPGGCTCPGTPPREQNSWHTLLKIFPCPKLRLWAAITNFVKKKSVKNTKGTRRKFVLTDMTLFLVLVIPGQNCAAEVCFTVAIVIAPRWSQQLVLALCLVSKVFRKKTTKWVHNYRSFRQIIHMNYVPITWNISERKILWLEELTILILLENRPNRRIL